MVFFRIDGSPKLIEKRISGFAAEGSLITHSDLQVSLISFGAFPKER